MKCMFHHPRATPRISTDDDEAKKPETADWEQSLSVGMATEAAGAAGLITGLFSKKTRKAVIAILAMPTSIYGFLLFVCNKLGVAEQFIPSYNIIDHYNIFPMVVMIGKSRQISASLRSVLAAQIFVGGFVTIICFILITLAAFLCSDRLLMKKSGVKVGGIVIASVLSALLCIDLYVSGGGTNDSALYSNTDYSIINLGIFHGFAVILYYGAVSAIVTMVKRPVFADGKGGKGHE